jgi:calcineurin-like phosphoesterase family protein
MTVFFSSDLHLSHRAVSFQRRYGQWPADKADVTEEDVAWHNDLLAQRWDAVVRPDDVVWVLGDLIANTKSLTKALLWIAARPGRKNFVWGNHDPGHPLHSDSHKWDEVYKGAFETVGSLRKRRILGQEVYLSHFPYEDVAASSKEGRFEQHRLPDLGRPVLHGHTHSEEQVTHTACGTIQIHCGVDAWDLGPVPLETITEILREILR